MREEYYNSELTMTPLLKEMGRALLKTPNFVAGIQSMVAGFQEYSDGETIVLAEMSELLEAAREARVFLGGIQLNPPKNRKVQDEDELFLQAQEAFQALDSVLFCKTALEHLKKLDIWKNTEVLSRLEEWQEDIAAWIGGEGGFSPLRLIVFQQIRRSILESFPEEVHYLFPWYEAFSEEEEGALFLLITNYDKIADPKKHSLLPEELRLKANAYYLELAMDKELRRDVAKAYKIHQALAKAINESFAIRLFGILEEASMATPYPDDLLEYGFGSIAAQIIKGAKNIYWNRREQIGMALLIGFCCEGLSDAVRFKLFSWVEDQMSKVDLGTSVNGSTGEKALSRLNTWVTSKVDKWLYSSEYENGLYALWFDEMRKNKNKVATSDEVSEEELCRLAEELIESYDKFWVIIQLLVGIQIIYKAASLALLSKVMKPLSLPVSMGPGAAPPPKFPTPYNLIGVPWVRREGIETFFEKSLRDIGDDAAKAYHAYEFSQERNHSYCVLYLGSEGEILDRRGPAPLPRRGKSIALELPENTAAVLFGIGPRTSLEAEWRILETPDLPVGEKSEVYWVLFAPPC